MEVTYRMMYDEMPSLVGQRVAFVLNDGSKIAGLFDDIEISESYNDAENFAYVRSDEGYLIEIQFSEISHIASSETLVSSTKE